MTQLRSSEWTPGKSAAMFNSLADALKCCLMHRPSPLLPSSLQVCGWEGLASQTMGKGYVYVCNSNWILQHDTRGTDRKSDAIFVETVWHSVTRDRLNRQLVGVKLTCMIGGRFGAWFVWQGCSTCRYWVAVYSTLIHCLGYSHSFSTFTSFSTSSYFFLYSTHRCGPEWLLLQHSSSQREWLLRGPCGGPIWRFVGHCLWWLLGLPGCTSRLPAAGL